MGFTDFFYKEILTNLISLSSSYTFSLNSLNLLLKASVVWAKNYEFLHFFLRGQLYLFRDLSQTSGLKFITKLFSASTWFIHFDGHCNYLHSFQKHPATSLKINATSLIRNTLAIRITNFLKQDLTFSSNTFQGPFDVDFAAVKASLVIISSNGNSSSCSRSGGGSGSDSDSTSTYSSSIRKIFSWTEKCKLGAISWVKVGKYNLGTRAGKCKVSVRVGKHRLGARAGRCKLRAMSGPAYTNWGPGPRNANWGPGPGLGNTKTQKYHVCTRKKTVSDKPWKNMLYDKTIPPQQNLRY